LLNIKKNILKQNFNYCFLEVFIKHMIYMYNHVDFTEWIFVTFITSFTSNFTSEFYFRTFQYFGIFYYEYYS